MSDDIKELIGRTKNIRAWGKKNYRLYAEAADAMEVLVKECDRMLIDLEEYRRDVAKLAEERDRLKDEVGRLRNKTTGTHGSPELDDDARKLEAMGQDPGATLEELLAPDPDLLREDAHERKRLESEYPWKE